LFVVIEKLKPDNLRPMAPDFNTLGAEVLAAIKNGVLPGAVVAVGHEGRVGFVQAFGNRQMEPEPEPATVDTAYDLASLTKAVVTSLLAMKAVEHGTLDPSTPLGRYLPALADRPEVTLRLVLAHAAGFAAHRRLYQRALAEGGPGLGSRAAVVEGAAQEPLVYPPGSKAIYSDLGFILLGDLLERSLEARLDLLADRLIFQPLQLASLGFVDLSLGSPPATFRGHAVAPTERCPVRGRLVTGEVHDLNAYAMAGIAGHAGLFGTVGDLLRLVLALCDAFQGGPSPLVDPEVLRTFWAPAGIPGSTWRLGWDGPAEHGSLAGSLISRRAVGHLSFTGCSLWIDPEQATAVVVLCNRIHPEVRDDARFRALRPALCDAALQAIGYRAR
jgi:CubicO group peptidase (beta-lactamase class C family)